jgi:hypothetical protein
VDDWETRRSPVRAASQSSRPPHDHDLIRELCERRAKGWCLISGETDEAECKAGFALKPQDRFADALRAREDHVETGTLFHTLQQGMLQSHLGRTLCYRPRVH